MILYTQNNTESPVDFAILNNSAVFGNCTIVQRAPQLNFLVVQVPVNNSTYYQNELLKIPGVLNIEPDVIRIPEILSPFSSLSSSATLVSDQWAFNRTNLQSARSLIRNETPPVTIAVLDTGVNISDTDLLPILNPHGFDWVENRSLVQDTDGHGTYLSGILYAMTRGENSTEGVNISLIPERVGTNASGIYASCSAAAIYHAADNGAQIILMGYGGSEQSPAEEAAITYATGKGCILIAPAGNDASNEGHYPSDYSDVISVGSTANSDGLSYFSNYGIFVDLVAPGENILSTGTNNSVISATGTSPAAVMVTGAAALVKSANPELNRDQIIGIITSSARDLGRTGCDIYYGSGLLNIDAAVRESIKQRTNLINTTATQTLTINSSHLRPHQHLNSSASTSIKRSISSEKVSVEIPLSSGWNFVSIPSFPASGKTSKDLFQGINTDGHTIWKYDAVRQDWISV
ncbi:MAG: S8 family serine peptidase, partial [Methanospirillum sp.]|uniref:S8 family peptidase n=1 Tax=Methanospirillum sp. TaxID=45200 RepID=UPI002372E49F